MVCGPIIWPIMERRKGVLSIPTLLLRLGLSTALFAPLAFVGRSVSSQEALAKDNTAPLPQNNCTEKLVTVAGGKIIGNDGKVTILPNQYGVHEVEIPCPSLLK
jgi:hypothetical protein